MDAQQTIDETLDAVQAPTTSAWVATGLAGHMERMGASLLAYAGTVLLAWTYLFGGFDAPPAVIKTYWTIAIANYLFLMWTACTIKHKLHVGGRSGDLGLYLLAALILNPLVLGWIMPLWVYLDTLAVRRRLSQMTA